MNKELIQINHNYFSLSPENNQDIKGSFLDDSIIKIIYQLDNNLEEWEKSELNEDDFLSFYNDEHNKLFDYSIVKEDNAQIYLVKVQWINQKIKRIMMCY